MANTISHGKRIPGEVSYRQALSLSVAEALRIALLELRLSYRKAAREIGISYGYLHGLTHGTRSPSVTVAERLIAVLSLDGEDAAALLAEAVEGAGRDWRPTSSR